MNFYGTWYFSAGMPHLIDLFETDFGQLSLQGIHFEAQEVQKVSFRLHVDFDSGAHFLTFYIPAGGDQELICRSLIAESRKLPPLFFQRTRVIMGFTEFDRISACETIFPGRIYLYLENDLSCDTIERLQEFGKQFGILVAIRQSDYLEKRGSNKQKVFISHDNADKEELAKHLAIRLMRHFNVWFSEFSLVVGDNLRKSIEKGLRECEYGIILLTPNYLLNHRWTEAELDVLISQHLEEGKKILPVWYEVNAEQVGEFSPFLKRLYGAQWDDGVENVFNQLYNAMNRRRN